MKKLEKLQSKKIEFTNKIKGGTADQIELLAIEDATSDTTTTAHKPTQTSEHVNCDHRVDVKRGDIVVVF